MTWLACEAPGATPLQRVIALRPDLDRLLQRYIAEAWSVGDPVVLEMCRLRIAMLHGDAAQSMIRHDQALEAGLTEAMVDALARYDSATCFTEHQRRCLAYAEQFVVDVHGLTDADAAPVRDEMGDAGFVAFTVALGLFDGLGRLRLALDIGAGDCAGDWAGDWSGQDVDGFDDGAPRRSAVVPTPSRTAASN